MRKFEYFISYNFKDEAGNTGLGCGVFELNEDLDKMSLSSIADCIMNSNNSSDGKDLKFVTVVPLFYHLRRVIEE